jgi:hypothetical protein
LTLRSRATAPTSDRKHPMWRALRKPPDLRPTGGRPALQRYSAFLRLPPRTTRVRPPCGPTTQPLLQIIQQRHQLVRQTKKQQVEWNTEQRAIISTPATAHGARTLRHGRPLARASCRGHLPACQQPNPQILYGSRPAHVPHAQAQRPRNGFPFDDGEIRASLPGRRNFARKSRPPRWRQILSRRRRP